MSDTQGEIPNLTLLQQLNSFIRDVTGRYMNLWSVLTLAAVALIIVVGALLWDRVDLRPALATIGAGLAAFLAPIPSIISPDLRGKWLVSILVSALIAAGTWFATLDLANHLQESKDQVAQLSQRLDRHKDAVFTLLRTAKPETIAGIEKEAASLLKSLFHAHEYDEVLDVALPLLKLDLNNGTSLSYVAYAYRQKGDFGRAKAYLENYLALASGIDSAWHGAQKDCYDDAAGFCGERTGWVSHLRAAIAVREAEQEANTAKKLKYYSEASEHEMRNVRIVKWGRPGKDEGFDASDEEKMSSCDVLQRTVDGLSKLGESTKVVLKFRKEHLVCG